MSSLYCTQGHLNPTDNRFCRLCGEPLQLAQSPQAAAHLLGWRYRVVSEVGQGGFGRTYLAEDTHRFNERCILKEFAPQDQAEQALQKAEELFAREAGILYQLQHSQIPRFRELFRAEWQGRERLFLVQDYVEGQTYYDLLQERRSRGQTFSETEGVQLLLQVLPVLDYIHSVGVIHRDISPDNLICRAIDGLPVLIDYGGVKQVAAKVVSASYPAAPRSPGTLTRLGKVGYAPAEQLEQGEVYPHSDLYALAVTVLVLLSGKEPQELFGAGGVNRRQWQHEVSLSPTLIALFNQLLDPYPAKRFQSADAVLQALERAGFGAAASKRLGAGQGAQVQPSMPASLPDPATIAVAPSFPIEHTQALLTPASASVKPVHRVLELRRLASWLLLAGMIGGGWWIGVKWLGPALKSKLPDIIQSGGKKQTINAPLLSKPLANELSRPEFSTTEQNRKQQIALRRQQLGVESSVWVTLVNAAFYAKHPERSGRPLGTGSDDAALRAEWDGLALRFLDRLDTLSPETRSRLGHYSDADLRDRQRVVNQLNLSSRALNDLTDAKFFQVFSEIPRGENVLNQPIGQVWQAIATDQLKALQSGQFLEKVQFPANAVSDRFSGTLKPGEGKAYLAQLTQDQILKLQLQSSANGIRLSLYPPTSKSPALLEDSPSTEWTGKLSETGLYEIVIIAAGTAPVNYTLDLTAAEKLAAK